MKYLNIKRAGISHKQIAKALGYLDVRSFRHSTKHKIIMQGLDELIGIAIEKENLKNEITKHKK